ncbi:hypothetical protein POM88_041434 [Heracleum sosnowskyi]|uniref:Uncharacterized protein n=1 Tax=Heracleum sosnowskyi TaxID=360622 RepID=A0AAD8HFW3_9APIA|nr:hypothetical protein POM88_041434 [Heracleum sosnowskyi]
MPRFKKGVLILSEFVGAAQSLGAGALLVNPWNITEVDSSIGQALNMKADEREKLNDITITFIMSQLILLRNMEWVDSVKGALETIQGRLTDGAWTIADSPLDLHDPRLLAMTTVERHLLEAEYDDSDANGAAFFRSVTLILMALLLLRHVLAMGDIDSDDVPYVDLVSLNMLYLFGIDLKALM